MTQKRTACLGKILRKVAYSDSYGRLIISRLHEHGKSMTVIDKTQRPYRAVFHTQVKF